MTACSTRSAAGLNGKVLAVEPEPHNLRLLEQNLKINQLTNVTVHPCALGVAEGAAKLGIYKPANRGRNSIVDTDAKPTIEVRLRTLDDLAKSSAGNVASWCLVKIDVEGYEGFVLEGAKQTLACMEMLVMEFSPTLLRKAGLDPASLLDKLSRIFLRICRIDRTDLVPTSARECLGHETQTEPVFER